jgi:phosphoenolpyruvate carboxykinase (GTP)
VGLRPLQRRRTRARHEGLELAPGALDELLAVDTEAWRAELPLIETHYEQFGDRLPSALRDELEVLAKRLADK